MKIAFLLFIILISGFAISEQDDCYDFIQGLTLDDVEEYIQVSQHPNLINIGHQLKKRSLCIDCHVGLYSKHPDLKDVDQVFNYLSEDPLRIQKIKVGRGMKYLPNGEPSQIDDVLLMKLLGKINERSNDESFFHFGKMNLKKRTEFILYARAFKLYVQDNVKTDPEFRMNNKFAQIFDFKIPRNFQDLVKKTKLLESGELSYNTDKNGKSTLDETGDAWDNPSEPLDDLVTEEYFSFEDDEDDFREAFDAYATQFQALNCIAERGFFQESISPTKEGVLATTELSSRLGIIAEKLTKIQKKHPSLNYVQINCN